MVKLRAGESFPTREEPRPRLVVGRKKAAVRASAGASKKSKAAGSSKPPPPPESAAAGDVTVEDTDALDCGVCFLPLKPPTFQCDVGHVVCSPCRDRLKAIGRCHLCSAATGGYRRWHAIERLVESIRAPCPHASYGCVARVAYHDREGQSRVCPHRPCHCPGEACGFVGPTAALLDHFSRAHGWSCTAEHSAERGFNVYLSDGFNFVTADRGADASGGQYLFLLNVMRQPFGRAVSVLCIRPHAADAGGPSKDIKCVIVYSYNEGGQLVNHYQQSEFRVACTDLSSGMPDPNKCYQFVVPTTSVDEEEDIEVTVWLFIN